MEFPRIVLYGVDVEGFERNEPPYTFYADVVFIDRSYGGGHHPSAYPIKDLGNPGETFRSEGISMIGEVYAIQRKEKRILLVDGNIVCYNHLILVNFSRKHGVMHNKEEFTPGIAALLDALKLRRQVAFDWTVAHKHQPDEPPGDLRENDIQPGKSKALSRMVGSVALNHMLKEREEEFATFSSRSPDKLYEIVL